jgi:CRISPR-associated protein Cpf1
VEKRREFLSSFDFIRYDAEKDAFAFRFNYDCFKNIRSAYQKEWTAYSIGKRIVYHTAKNGKQGYYETVEPTAALKTALDKHGISYQNRENLVNDLKDKIVNDLFHAVKNTLQVRNSRSDTGEDFIISPIPDENGTFYNSERQIKGLPYDGDANGAYHIALKGLYLLQTMNEESKLKIENKDWFRFVQERPFR